MTPSSIENIYSHFVAQNYCRVNPPIGTNQKMKLSGREKKRHSKDVKGTKQGISMKERKKSKILEVV